MINFPINSASQNKKYFISPQKNAENSMVSQHSMQENKKTDKNKTKNSGKIWVTLSAMAVAGCAFIGIYRAAKGHKNVPPVVSEPVVNLLKLKEKIKKDYLSKKNEILKMSDLQTDNGEIQKYRDIHKNVSTDIKNKLKRLAGDSDWTELRKIRKKLLKTLENEKSGEQHDIADKKIELLNNILICKIHPEEEEAFKGKVLMDLSDAVELIKKDFTSLSEFRKEYSARQKYEFDLDLNEKFFYTDFKLTLRDLFPDDMKEYDFSKEKIRELYDEPKKKRHEKLKQLALEFRADENVKTFKKLNAEKV